MNKKIYKLDFLINKLEDIRQGNDDALNFPNAFYCLALEIQKLSERIEHLEYKVPDEGIQLSSSEDTNE